VDKWHKKRHVMKRYDLTAHLYDVRYEAEQRAKYEAALENLPSGEFGLVLDAGCGTGLLFSYLADLAEAIVGLDISRKTLMLSKSRARGFKNVHLMAADDDHMPFKQDTFDHVFAITLIQNSPDPIETLNEIVRVVRNDAVVVVTGLKRIFSLNDFKKLLQNRLRIIALEGEGLQCHVAVCVKYSTESEKV
jgi:ubiquinone/menaquinone biosynthesis C-methylase UbiE